MPYKAIITPIKFDQIRFCIREFRPKRFHKIDPRLRNWTSLWLRRLRFVEIKFFAKKSCSTLIDIVRHWSTLFDIDRHCSTLIDIVRHWSTLFDIDRHCSTFDVTRLVMERGQSLFLNSSNRHLFLFVYLKRLQVFLVFSL
jgi:hypothetical protein